MGQPALTAALKHAITTQRLAHAYLFCGSRGVGKTSCARIFAKTINCTNRTPDGEACNECESCKAFNSANSFNIIELDAASHNGVEDIRALNEQVLMPPTDGKYRVFIIDEVHMLSTAAFNAFLKTLEEPPAHAIFVLATTEKHKVIPTILSRCQIFDFNRITVPDIVAHLASVAASEGIEAEKAALAVIARQADGAMRDALSIFDQVAAASMGHITYKSTIDNLNILDDAYYGRLIDDFLAVNIPDALLTYKEIRDKGFDSHFFIVGLGLYLRDLMLASSPSTLPLIETDEDTRARLAQTAQKCSPQFLYKALDLCNEADLNFRAATNKQFLIELTLIKLCQLCSPSPSDDSVGEGQLKPIAVKRGQAAAAQPAVASPAAQAQPPQSAALHRPRPAAVQPVKAPQRRPSLSIRGFSKKAEEPTVAAEPEMSMQPHRSEPYTRQALVEAWKEYALAHPTERILSSTMQASEPLQIDGKPHCYLVGVDDSIQVEAFANARISILKHLCDTLKNDDIDFEVQILDGGSSPLTWNEREVLEHMVKERPYMVDFIKQFNLTL